MQPRSSHTLEAVRLGGKHSLIMRSHPLTSEAGNRSRHVHDEGTATAQQ